MSSMFDTDDDLSLRTRRGADERSRERAVEMDDHSPADREVTLNTGTVLALFFALALICAVFFGFGYSMGRKSTQAPVTAAASDSSSSDSASADDAGAHAASDKPAPGSPAIQPVPGYMSQQEASDANGAATKTVAPAKTTPAPEPVAVKTTTAAATPALVVRTPPAPVAPAPAAPTAAPIAGAVYVQIAAVSHQEDADVLKSALSRRGYKVVERSDANDRLIHVQIGPFSDRKAAEGTRQKLLGDGYNAFLK